MKNLSLFLLGLCAVASAALATPRETANLIADNGGFINSMNLLNNAQNVTITHTFVGGYTANFLTISGTINGSQGASWQSEANIFCTPPGGTGFIIQPYTANIAYTAPVNTPAGAYAVPLAPAPAAGAWTFQFFDRFDDIPNGVDGHWEACSITLDDGVAPAAAPIGPLGQTYTNVTISGTAAAPSFDQTFTAPAGTGIAGIRIRLQATGTGADTAASTTITPIDGIRVQVTPPSGVPLAVTQPFALAAASTSVTELLQSLPAVSDSGGNWRVVAYQGAANPLVARARTLAIELVPQSVPANTDLGTLVMNVQKDGAATVTAGQTKWFKFNMPVALSAADNRALEIDTEGSAVGDTSIGLYSSSGARVNADFLDGTGSLAALSFGVDNHPGPGGDALPFNGRDGVTLASGDYYLAVTAGDAGIIYQPGLFGVTNTSALAGGVQVHIRWLEPGAVQPVATDIGVVGGTSTGGDLLTTQAVDITPGAVRWLRFRTLADALAAVDRYLDIDTETTAGIDTMLGLYRNDGSLVAFDDDDGTGLLTQLSFGDSAAPRPSPGGDAQIYNARDGDLVAGQYFLAVTVFPATFNPTFWNVTSTGAATGTINVNFHSNIPSACSLADVGIQGGVPGHDRRLDNNDFIVFINAFFAGNTAIADLGIQGGVPGHDGVLDNNDFIVFINAFFADQALCTG